MKLVIQRVKEANVKVNNNIIGKIDKGLMILLGVGKEDTKETADYLVRKLYNLRIFEDQNDKMNLSIKDVNGELLIVSQFTLYANTKDGNRPSFTDSAKPEMAKEIYEYFIMKCRENNLNVQTGKFGEHMEVSLINDGPVTIIMEK